MVEKTGFIKPKRDYAVFVIVTCMGGGIPLVIEKGNFQKKCGNCPEVDLLLKIKEIRKLPQ